MRTRAMGRRTGRHRVAAAKRQGVEARLVDGGDALRPSGGVDLNRRPFVNVQAGYGVAIIGDAERSANVCGDEPRLPVPLDRANGCRVKLKWCDRVHGYLHENGPAAPPIGWRGEVSAAPGDLQAGRVVAEGMVEQLRAQSPGFVTLGE